MTRALALGAVIMVSSVGAALALYVGALRPAHEAATWERDYGHYEPSRSNAGLSYRINHACRKGDTVTNWTTGDEFEPLPKGTVRVTCMKRASWDLYYVSVPL